MTKQLPTKCIIADPKVAHGKPVFRGTRVMVWQVLELLEAGEDKKDIYKAYPNLPDKAIEEALHYAAEKAKQISYMPFRRKITNAYISA